MLVRSEATRRKRAHGYGRWLRFLQSHGRLVPALDPVGRFTRADAAAYIDELRTRLNGTAIWSPLEDLCAVLGAMQPDQDLAWLRAALARVKATSSPARRIQPRLVVAGDLWR